MALKPPGCEACRFINNDINLQGHNASIITFPSLDPCATDDLILTKSALEAPTDQKRDKGLSVSDGAWVQAFLLF